MQSSTGIWGDSWLGFLEERIPGQRLTHGLSYNGIGRRGWNICYDYHMFVATPTVTDTGYQNVACAWVPMMSILFVASSFEAGKPVQKN